jgi:hypothetical protein
VAVICRGLFASSRQTRIKLVQSPETATIAVSFWTMMLLKEESDIRSAGQPRTDTPPTVPLPALAPEAVMAAPPAEPLNVHEKALIAFSEYLEREIEESIGKPTRTAAMMAGPLSQVETAKNRAKVFLAQQKAKAGGG